MVSGRMLRPYVADVTVRVDPYRSPPVAATSTGKLGTAR